MFSPINKIQEKFNNKETRVVASNFVWLSMLQVASYVFPLITIPYLARVIGSHGFGEIAFASAIMVWIQTIADWGFNLTATRDIAQNRDDKEKISHIFSAVIYSRILLSVVAFIILLILVVSIPRFYESAPIILLTFLMVPGHILYPTWFFQAIEKMRYITLLSVLMKAIFTVAVFVFIRSSEDYILYPLLMSLGYIFSGVLAIYLVLIRWEYKLCTVSFKEIIYTIRQSTNVFINTLAPNLYNSFSTVLLGFYGTNKDLGIYDGGIKFTQLGERFLVVVEQTFFPFLSRRIDKHKIYAKLNFFASLLIATILFFAAPLLVDWFLSDEFRQSVVVIRIRAVSLVFFALSNIYGKNYLILRHKDKVLRKITLYCSIVGFIIAWPLSYYWGYVGSAFTVTISLFLMALFTYLSARKIMKN